MKNNTGYREMLRDRCPKVVSYALKWCKSKEAWLDYVYKTQIWIFSSKKERLNQTKLILGIDGKVQKFDFDSTIFWEGLNQDERANWKRVSGWVKFFVTNYAYIENTYNISKSLGKDIVQCKIEIISRWLTSFCPTPQDDVETVEKKNKFVNELTDFLIDCFEGNV